MNKKSSSKAKKKKTITDYSRSPTLNTIKSVEKFIEKHPQEYNKTEIWKKLPKKVMWQTYLVVLRYMEEIGKIEKNDKGKIYIIKKADKKNEITAITGENKDITIARIKAEIKSEIKKDEIQIPQPIPGYVG